MVSELITGMGAFKTMLDIAKGLKDITNTATRHAAEIVLQQKILDAQAAQAELVEELNKANAKIADMERWTTESKRYQLKEIAPGVFAYELRQDMSKGEPSHRICPTCYENSRKSILQPHKLGLYDFLRCPVCKTKLEVKRKQFDDPRMQR
jgi:hypothetical protein